MIDRYSRKVMRDIWSEENKFNTYLKVEISNAKALVNEGICPKEDFDKLLNTTFTIKRIKEIEEVTKHDVVAFTRACGESLGDEKKWIHYGLTSTDVVDTANGVLLKEANEVIDKDINEMLKVLKKRALEFKDTPCIGRTHGMHADITSFGLKWALWYSDLERAYNRFLNARKEVEVGKLSGAVGNFANISPSVEEFVCKDLGLDYCKISTQVIQRDRYASYMSSLALIGAELEKMALEIRNLSRQEVKEVEEAFSKGQKGSSAMPHKRNPISSENICGCARVLRGYMLTSFENIALWHERDISHSSTERIIFPDATTLLDYMLNRFNGILLNLFVYKDKMLDDIYLTKGVIFAQRVLYALISKGLVREASYDLIQPIAMISLEKNLNYKDLLKENKDVKKYLTDEEIDECFTLDYYFKEVDTIYKRLNLIK
jgi:adenylosuccinate lyase